MNQEHYRNKAWRQEKAKQKKVNKCQTMINSSCYSSEKNWKIMYLRSEKLRRAKQLGMEYPRKSLRQILDQEMPIDNH